MGLIRKYRTPKSLKEVSHMIMLFLEDEFHSACSGGRENIKGFPKEIYSWAPDWDGPSCCIFVMTSDCWLKIRKLVEENEAMKEEWERLHGLAGQS